MIGRCHLPPARPSRDRAPRTRGVSLSLAVLLTFAAPAAATETSLLRPGAVSYAASGSYGLSANRDWADLSFGVFAPSRVTDQGGRFDALRFSLVGTPRDQTLRFSLGRSWRSLRPGGQVWGLNAYLDLGAPHGQMRMMGQASLGVEYEQVLSGPVREGRLRFGSNLYLPLADYAARPRLAGRAVPRRGVDGYVDWRQSLGAGLELGGRVSLFHYPATRYRPARGIGTLSLNGRMTRNLPPGSALEARLGARYAPGEAPVPQVGMTYHRAMPHPGASVSAPVGALRPASDCRIRPEAHGIDRLDCGDSSYEPPLRYEVYGPLAGARLPGGSVTVPAPERHLGYGTLFVP